jgi:hypothetical protein
MSGKLNTKDIKVGGDGGVPKTLQPGNQKCKLNGARLEEFKFIPGGYHLVLSLEGAPIEKDFEGFWIDKNDESLGKHAGQVGDVKASEWAYADGKTKSGIEISRDAEILKVMKNLCIAFGCTDWLDAQDDKHDTIESLIAAFSKDRPFKEKFIDFCIGGKEYTNRNGYTAYDLFLPKYSKAGAAYGTKVVTFDPIDHIKKKKTEEISEFESGEDINLGGPAGADFSL